MNDYQRIVKYMVQGTTKNVVRTYVDKRGKKNRVKKYEIKGGFVSYRKVLMIARETIKQTDIMELYKRDRENYKI